MVKPNSKHPTITIGSFFGSFKDSVSRVKPKSKPIHSITVSHSDKIPPTFCIVQPVYKCSYCGMKILGELMEISNRPKKDLIVDVMDMAAPQFEPHVCMGSNGEHGVIEYVGFNLL
jgi:hypothetical protein